MADPTNDNRFSHIAKDPRFRHMKKKDRKVKIDDRFHGMFKDDRFKLKYTVDKRGRPVKTSNNEHLRRYYDLSSDENDSEDESGDQEGKDMKVKSKKKQAQKASSTGEETVSPSKVEKKKKKSKEIVPYKQEQDKTEHKKKRKDVDANVKGKSETVKEGSIVDGGDSGSDDSEDSSVRDGEEEDEEQVDASVSDAEESEEDGTKDVKNDADEDDDDGSSGSDSDEDDDSEDELDLARGQGNVESSSSDEDDDEEEEEEEEEEVDHDWGELDKRAPVVEDATSRLAVCNMDWDRIKAVDLMVLLNSFKPTGGVIKSVSIYPSEFGIKRMQEEDVMGPKEVVESARELQSKNMIETEEGDAYHRERLRQYQLNRLKYYYAIVDCDSANTANAVYEGADGVEYESSATRMDLRFVPEDMGFDQTPKSVCAAMPDGSTYQPTLFTNTALNQSKVDLTWDETDKDRITMTMRKFTKDDLEKMDFNDYLAGSSDEEDDGVDPYGGFEEPDFGTPAEEQHEDNEEEKLEKYKELIKGIKTSEEDKEKKDTELEITWEPGLKETTTEIVKKKTKHKDGLSPWEEYLEKKKEKRKQKREQKAGPSTEGDEDGDDDDVAAAMSDDELPSDVDLDDPYFKEELSQTGDNSSTKTGKKKKKRMSKEEKEELNKKEAELAMLMMDEDDGKAHFSLKGIQDQEKVKKKKRKLKKKNKEAAEPVQDGFELDVQDPRFKDIYQNPMFNIDPSAPEFKKTKATERLIEEKQKRRIEDKKQDKRKLNDGDDTSIAKKKKISSAMDTSHQPDTSLSSLVKSVKAKTKTLQEKKKKKLK